MDHTQKSSISVLTKKNKILYLDILRALACLLVVMIHSSMNYAVQEVGSKNFWVGNFFDSISRAAVPLFVMISGALMLDENYHFTKEKWIKHIVKLILFYIFWSTAYSLAYNVAIPLLKHGSINITSILKHIVDGHFHLWFIPMIIGLYLLLPILRLWIKVKNIKLIEYYLVLSILFSFVINQITAISNCVFPSLQKTALFNNMGMQHCSGYIIYFILGWYLANKNIRKNYALYPLGILALVITIVGTWAIFNFTNSREFIFYSNFAFNVLAYSVSIFLLCKFNFRNISHSNSKLHKALSILTENSLGIYAMHAFIQENLYPRLLPHVCAQIAIPATFIACIVISTIASIIIRHIPFLKRFV